MTPACQGELLYNGICLPKQWPPRVELSREAPTPSYLSQPPPVINIDLGRQLLVDDFLIENADNTKRTWYQAKLLKEINPVLRPTEPWETVIDSGVAEPAFSRGFSGGVWWIPAENVFKLWCVTFDPHAPCTYRSHYCGPLGTAGAIHDASRIRLTARWRVLRRQAGMGAERARCRTSTKGRFGRRVWQ